MTINFEKLKKYRESQQSGVGKTFSMLVGAVEFVRDHPSENILVIAKSTLDIMRMKEEMKAVATDLHVTVEEEFENTLVLGESHVLFALPGVSSTLKRDHIFVDHAVIQAFVLGQK